jgi:hypothetical protein
LHNTSEGSRNSIRAVPCRPRHPACGANRVDSPEGSRLARLAMRSQACKFSSVPSGEFSTCCSSGVFWCTSAIRLQRRSPLSLPVYHSTFALSTTPISLVLRFSSNLCKLTLVDDLIALSLDGLICVLSQSSGRQYPNAIYACRITQGPDNGRW